MPKRILIIYPNNILPIDTGSKKNTFEMIKELQSKGFNITLFCCVNQIKNSKEILNYVDRLVEYQNPLNNIFLKVVNKFLNVFINDMINENIILKFFLKKKIQLLCDKHDVIILHYVTLYNVIPNKSLPKTIIFTHALMHLQPYIDNYGVKTKNQQLKVERIKRKEMSALKKFGLILVVTNDEKNVLIENKIPVEKIFIIGAPMTVFDIKIGTPPYYFGFIGGDFNQNIFSVEYFINNFYKNFPEKPFCIAGKVCENKYIKGLPNIYPNIKLCGYVENLPKFYSSFRFLVATLPIGSGIKIKVLEAMSFGSVVLGSNYAFEGINIRHLYEAINVEGMKPEELKLILSELESSKKFSIVSKNAKQFIKQNFGKEQLFRPLMTIIKSNF